MYKATQVPTEDGIYICIEINVPAPKPELIDADGHVLLVNYLTPEQWDLFKLANGKDISS